jgi:RimJ/RimL family protein N-acetyltransferase
VSTHYSRDPENTQRFVAELGGNAIGYFQYHRCTSEHVGTDQFLANGEELSKGVGTSCLLAFIEMIDETERPSVISVDPDPDNKRAIRCNEKCGFVHDPSRPNSTTYYMTKTT